MFNRLPPDNFPDDTETAAFQNYREGGSSLSLSLPFNLRRWLIYIGIALLVMLIGGGIILTYQAIVGDDDNQPVANNIIPSPTATEQGVVMLGSFPPMVPQTFINVPARINDSLVDANGRGYTFEGRSGFTWQISVTPADGFAPQIDIYGKGGQLLTSTSAGANTPASINYFIDEDGLYAIHLYGQDGTTGSYTLSMLPQ